MNRLYFVTRVITFLGAQSRAFFEHVVCRVFKIPVEDDRALRSSELCGHVEHELIKSAGQSFLMCFVPFFLNLFLGSCMLLFGSFRLFYVGDFTSVAAYAVLYLGFSLVANCAPSFEDALSFKDNLYGGGRCKTALKIILSPFFAVAYASAFLERYSLTFLLSIAYAIALPYIVSALIF